eukprot:Gb_29174 [translate_table: standard]
MERSEALRPCGQKWHLSPPADHRDSVFSSVPALCVPRVPSYSPDSSSQGLEVREVALRLGSLHVAFGFGRGSQSLLVGFVLCHFCLWFRLLHIICLMVQWCWHSPLLLPSFVSFGWWLSLIFVIAGLLSVQPSACTQCLGRFDGSGCPPDGHPLLLFTGGPISDSEMILLYCYYMHHVVVYGGFTGVRLSALEPISASVCYRNGVACLGDGTYQVSRQLPGSGGANAGWCREAFPLLRPQKDVFFIALQEVLARLGGRDNGRRIMGGDPVTTEPAILKVDEEARDILDRVGLLTFFQKNYGFNENISLQVVETWNDGKVTMNGLEFIITEQLIADVSGLPREGEIISKEKTNQLRCDAARSSLQGRPFIRIFIFPWRFIPVRSCFHEVRPRPAVFIFFHHDIVQPLCSRPQPNCSRVTAETLGQGGSPNHEVSHIGRGGFPKAQLLLGPAPTSPVLKSSTVISDTKEDSKSQGEDIPFDGSKKDGVQKRKPPPQVLTANLAKCSRRSTRLQKKLAEKSKVVDFVEPTEEIEDSNTRKSVEVGKSTKDVGPGISDKGSAKGPDGTHNLMEDLKCHLKLLNSLGGSLTSTCACINLLTLEITNYLKEVVSNLKELSSTRNQQ